MGLFSEADISVIVENEQRERDFFNWCRENDILWTFRGTDLNYIFIFNDDVKKVLKYWKEIEIIENEKTV